MEVAVRIRTAIGFDLDEPEYEYHGESMHPDAVAGQCMCGHPDYWQCKIEREDWS